MRVAVLADIRGNLPALRAVLAELDRDPSGAVLDRHWRDGLAAWPITLALDAVAGFADFDAQLKRSLLEPADPDSVSVLLECTAGRGGVSASSGRGIIPTGSR
jgi:hypothetical protein